MNKFLEFIVDNAINIIMITMLVLFVWSAVMLIESGQKANENVRKLTDVCYSQGMVLVNTDAGQRCADPRTLVTVK